MKLARYRFENRIAIGIVEGDTVLDVSAAVPDAPASIEAMLAAGTDELSRIERLARAAARARPLAAVRLECPIPHPQKYLAIGMNYHDHAEEARKAGIPIPTTQLWFNKQVTCVTGPYDAVCKPKVSDRMDYEAELGVVIGKRCRYVPEDDALSVVGGYFVANDLTARDWQQASPTFTLGKSFDTHGPIGPWIVTADEIGDPQALELRCYVNGELRQQQSTAKMIYSVAQQIAHLSKVVTLMPGDLIATGTCSGIGAVLGKFLQPGDVVRVEVDRIGHIENRVILEP
jgi:2-keto-4-pentenoate hydratase/2-oxohepta-3-ene-1,7-dioic acid hydratase in catechol pathway